MDENKENNNDIVREITDATKPMGFGERLSSIFLSPTKLMENIKEFPKPFAPLPIFIVVFLIIASLTMRISEITMAEQSLVVLERYGIDFLNFDALDYSGFSIIASVSAFVSGIIGIYINAFFATLLIFIISKIMRCGGKFLTFYSMFLHIAIITSILSVITSIFYIITGSSIDVLSLGILMPNGTFLDPSYMLLSSISVANIWKAILIFIGFKTINETTPVKAAIAAIIDLLVTIGLSVAMAVGISAYYNLMFNMFS